MVDPGENQIPKNEILRHYQGEDVRKAILSAGKVGRAQRALITGSDGWYQYRKSGEKTEVALKPLDSTYYDREIPKMVERGKRSLYWSLNFFEPSIFSKWVSRKNRKEGRVKSPGGYPETIFYQLGADIDLIDKEKRDDLKRDRNVEHSEDREMLEEAIQFSVNWLMKNGLSRKAVKPYFSGGGGYVTINPSICSFKCEPEKAALICTAFNFVIKQVERDFFEEFEEGEKFVQFDALNNEKRQWKTILSVHKSRPFACTPLNPKRVEIDLEKARLPLSEGVISEAQDWVEWTPTKKSDKYTRELGELLNKPLVDVEPCADLVELKNNVLEGRE